MAVGRLYAGAHKRIDASRLCLTRGRSKKFDTFANAQKAVEMQRIVLNQKTTVGVVPLAEVEFFQE